MKYYFHICCNEDKFSGTGNTCYEAAVNAIGEKRAKALGINTTQTHYKIHGEIVGKHQEGVSNFMSKNGFTIASVTRLLS